MQPSDIQRVVWINLDRATERRDAFLRRVAATAWPFRAPERVPGIEMDPPPWWRSFRNAWGIFRAHAAIWHSCLCLGIQRVLIFEDDAVFCPDFGAKVREWLPHVPADWDAVYLGGNHFYLPERVNAHVLRGTCCSALHAYCLTSLAMMKAFRVLQVCPNALRDKNFHVDTFLATMMDAGKLTAYCPPQWFCGQAAGPSFHQNYSFSQDVYFDLPEKALDRLELVTC